MQSISRRQYSINQPLNLLVLEVVEEPLLKLRKVKAWKTKKIKRMRSYRDNLLGLSLLSLQM